MTRCEHCPIKEGRCRAEVDPRYGFLCRLAASGEGSKLASIKALSGTAAVPVQVVEVVQAAKQSSPVPTKGGGCGCGGDYPKAERWFRGLSEEEREATGITAKSKKGHLLGVWKRAGRPV